MTARVDSATRERIAKLTALLGSPHEGEAVAALHGLGRVLAANGLDFNDLAALIAADRAEPVERYTPAAEAEWMGWSVPNNATEWFELICELVDREAWNNLREKDFVYAVWERTNSGRSPSEAQAQWLLDIRAKYRDHRTRGP